jgi:hypothetical protein
MTPRQTKESHGEMGRKIFVTVILKLVGAKIRIKRKITISISKNSRAISLLNK